MDRTRQRLTRDAAVHRQALDRLAGVLRDEAAPPLPGAAPDAHLARERALGAVVRECGLTQPAPEPAATDTVETWARRAGLVCRAVTLRDDWWRFDPAGPLLARHRDGTPRAISAAGPHLRLLDPATGHWRRLTPDAAAELAPEAHLFYCPLPRGRAAGVRDLLRIALGPGTRRLLAPLVTIGLLGATLGLLVPVLTGVAFDTVLPDAAQVGLYQIVAAALAAPVAVGVLQWTRALLYLRLRGRVEVAVQAAVMDRALHVPVSLFQTHSAGDLTDRVQGPVAILHALTAVAVDSVLGALFAVTYLVLMLAYSAPLGLLAAGLALALAFSVAVVVPGLRRHLRTYREQHGRLQSLMLELLGGITKLRVAAAEERAFLGWATRFAAARQAAYRAGRATIATHVSTATLGVISLAAVYLAVPTGGELSTGGFVAFLAAFGVFQSALTEMFLSLVRLAEVAPLLERLRPVLDARPEDDGTGLAPGRLAGRIRVAGVSFRYSADGPRVLDDVSLHAEPGELVAIVGPSGSGKSTLLRLLLGFATPDAGSVSYDGLDLRSLDRGALRRQLGAVLQGGQLLPDTVFANIAGGAPLTLEAAWAAARQAGVAEEIEAMPMQLHTFLNEGATTISGGQKQRILLARALARGPTVLLLDEATSALDNRTQAHVAAHLEALGITRIVVAHRLSTVRHADRIYVMERGLIVES